MVRSILVFSYMAFICLIIFSSFSKASDIGNRVYNQINDLQSESIELVPIKLQEGDFEINDQWISPPPMNCTATLTASQTLTEIINKTKQAERSTHLMNDFSAKVVPGSLPMSLSIVRSCTGLWDRIEKATPFGKVVLEHRTPQINLYYGDLMNGEFTQIIQDGTIGEFDISINRDALSHRVWKGQISIYYQFREVFYYNNPDGSVDIRYSDYRYRMIDTADINLSFKK